MKHSLRLETREEHARLEAKLAEQWQADMHMETMLKERGFDGDEDVVMLGLEEMEDELTQEQIMLERFARPTHRQVIPASMATVEEARQAREADIDDMNHPEWNDEA